MSNNQEQAVLEVCAGYGLEPISDPMGDDHHCDAPFSEEDKDLGGALAWFLGSLFSDVQGEHSKYWYHERTSVDEWSRVVRALRIHGLKIVNLEN